MNLYNFATSFNNIYINYNIQEVYMTIKVSEITPAYRNVEVYMFQDADDVAVNAVFDRVAERVESINLSVVLKAGK